MYIKTSRLLLRDYISSDVSNYILLKSTQEVWKYSTFVPYQNEDHASTCFQAMLDTLSDSPYQFAALFKNEGNTFIGEAGIIALNTQVNRCTVGYNLLPEYWNRGYATEINKAIIKYAFEELKVERIEALAIQSNVASCKVLQKSGFSLEGTLRHFTRIRDEYQDVCYYAIISSDMYSKH